MKTIDLKPLFAGLNPVQNELELQLTTDWELIFPYKQMAWKSFLEHKKRTARRRNDQELANKIQTLIDKSI